MNPNQQGYYQPEPVQPAQPVQPPVPQQPVSGSLVSQHIAAPTQRPAQQQPVAAAQQPVAATPVSAPAPVQQVQFATPEGELPVVAAQLPNTDPDPLPEDEEEHLELTDEPVTWSALEYIHQEKSAAWFSIFGVIVVVLLGVTVFFQQWSFAILIVVIVAVIIVSSKRPPRELAYGLSDDGLSIDGKMHPFEDFKAFGVIRDGQEYSVMLIPTQRFQPGVTVYFPEQAGEDIVDMLGSRLPMKDLHLDAVDRVVRLLRL